MDPQIRRQGQCRIGEPGTSEGAALLPARHQGDGMARFGLIPDQAIDHDLEPANAAR
jgi:hypothetical protein